MNQANDSTTEGQNTDCGVQFNAVSLSLIKTRDNTYYVTLNNLTKDFIIIVLKGIWHVGSYSFNRDSLMRGHSPAK